MYARRSRVSSRSRKASPSRKALYAARHATAIAIRSSRVSSRFTKVLDRLPAMGGVWSYGGPIGLRQVRNLATGEGEFSASVWKLDFPNMQRSFYMSQGDNPGQRRGRRVFLRGVTIDCEASNIYHVPGVVRFFVIVGKKRELISTPMFSRAQRAVRTGDIASTAAGADLPAVVERDGYADGIGVSSGYFQRLTDVTLATPTANEILLNLALSRIQRAVRTQVQKQSFDPGVAKKTGQQRRRNVTIIESISSSVWKTDQNSLQLFYGRQGGHVMHFDAGENVVETLDSDAVVMDSTKPTRCASRDGFTYDFSTVGGIGTGATLRQPWALLDSFALAQDLMIPPNDRLSYNAQGINSFCRKYGHLLPWAYGNPMYEAFDAGGYLYGLPGYSTSGFGDMRDVANFTQAEYDRFFDMMQANFPRAHFRIKNTTDDTDATYAPLSYRTVPDGSDGRSYEICLNHLSGTTTSAYYSGLRPWDAGQFAEVEQNRYNSFRRAPTRIPNRPFYDPRVRLHRVVSVGVPPQRTPFGTNTTSSEGAAQYSRTARPGERRYVKYIPINKVIAFDSEEAYSARTQVTVMACAPSFGTWFAFNCKWHYSE